MTYTPLDEKFLAEFKRKTEGYWQQEPISGFQSPRGARWNPGLSDEKIDEYEKALGVRFPHDFRLMLKSMNGTFYPKGTPDPFATIRRHRAASMYSFPRDIKLIRQRIRDLQLEYAFADIQTVLRQQGFEFKAGAGLVPIYAHRYILCGSDPSNSAVLSIMGTDAILYGSNLREYLEKEFLPASDSS
jgi:hypothetical protein